ncbi:glucosaminidase domain-containing protein [Eremococcus coleocola]|uniref:Mannosyl-glycoprotein endo-beta-N-acetylglucosaminidase n=1 Tax=Eremococcus coleocola ACS-139-V-Col8 TaxID=908337 RepID=E4KQG4_9LACT|nr:glucosaminidase domain-containing protein [Eremococcus coleocola]EFR30600.1 mannosyl-glycoprotein endo-beta-N-acetylglucosaminidase [Eremococcus coleocola ACS-139-V-Col8]
MGFIEDISALYVKHNQSSVLNSILIAQACLESNYGKSELAVNAHNYGGIKANKPWSGDTYTKLTQEWDGTKYILVKAEFAKFSSMEEFVKYHSNFFTSTPWRANYYGEVLRATTYQGQAEALTGTYATDPSYAKKIIKIIQDYNLTQYDLKEDDSMVKMPQIINRDLFHGVAGSNGNKPKYIVIHNDAGAMTPQQYIGWLQRERSGSNAKKGFAHYYINRDQIVRVENTYSGAWACANPEYNRYALSYEVCEQLKVNNQQWLENERMTFIQVAEDCHYYGIVPSRKTFALHHDVSTIGTSCPERSAKTHGGYKAVLDYFINQVTYYMSKGKTVQEIIANINKGTDNTPKAKLSNDEVAQLVIKGRYGNGVDRIKRLTADGYDPKVIQAIVDKIKGKKPNEVKKEDDRIFEINGVKYQVKEFK